VDLRKLPRDTRRQFRGVLELRPDYLDALFLKAKVSSRAQAYYKAETELLRVLEYSPDDAPARRLLAEVYMALGKPRKAVGVARPLAESGDQGSLFMALLDEAVQQGQDAEMQAWFSDLLEKRKSNAAASTGRAGPESEIWLLSRCRVLVHFCEQCLFVRGCI
jgi:tetratricopeptide (TPR) repeat protein